MTTQMPYEPAPAQPMPAYPTAPPWAPPAPPAGAAPEGPPWAATPYTQHGQLMVPYPELMHAAGRPAGPSWVPVAVTTFLLSVLGTTVSTVAGTVFLGMLAGILLGAAGGALGLLGAVSAARRARRARKGANPRHPYWLAFGLALLAAAPAAVGALNVTARLVQKDLVEPAIVHAVQSDIVHGTDVKTAAGATVQSADCSAEGNWRSDGLREYRCVVTVSTGQSGTVRVLADRKGNVVAVKVK